MKKNNNIPLASILGLYSGLGGFDLIKGPEDKLLKTEKKVLGYYRQFNGDIKKIAEAMNLSELRIQCELKHLRKKGIKC